MKNIFSWIEYSGKKKSVTVEKKLIFAVQHSCCVALCSFPRYTPSPWAREFTVLRVFNSPSRARRRAKLFGARHSLYDTITVQLLGLGPRGQQRRADTAGRERELTAPQPLRAPPHGSLSASAALYGPRRQAGRVGAGGLTRRNNRAAAVGTGCSWLLRGQRPVVVPGGGGGGEGRLPFSPVLSSPCEV